MAIIDKSCDTFNIYIRTSYIILGYCFTK